MNHILKIFTFSIVLAIALVSCEPVQYGKIGVPFSKLESVEGTWVATKVIQVDETAVSQGGLYQEMDLTDLYNFTSYSITFNLDADTLPSTFSVSTAGAPSFIDTMGTWSFNDNDFPSEIHFTHPDSADITSKLYLIAPPRDQNPLRVKFLRFSKEKLIVSYQYIFERQTQ